MVTATLDTPLYTERDQHDMPGATPQVASNQMKKLLVTKPDRFVLHSHE